MDTIARSEMVEKELDTMIRRRHDKRVASEGERAAEEMYEASCRRFSERELTQRLWERLRYHEGQARRLSTTVAAIVACHKAEAQRYAQMLGIQTTKGAA